MRPQRFVQLPVSLYLLLLLLPGSSYAQWHRPELAIRNVRVFDSRTKRVRAHQTILIDAGRIVRIVSADRPVRADHGAGG